jgi:hypothetical protein
VSFFYGIYYRGRNKNVVLVTKGKTAQFSEVASVAVTQDELGVE